MAAGAGCGAGWVVVMSELTASSMSSVDGCSCCSDWLLVSAGRGDEEGG